MKLSKFNNPKQLVSINTKLYKFDINKKVSAGQKQIQDFLLQYVSPEYILQELRIPGSLKRLDLVLFHKKIVIEYSPKSHHGTFNKFFHGNRLEYLKTIKSDIQKQEYVERNGYTFIELSEKDLPLLSYDFFVQEFNVYL
jgi:hypothetical protein